MTKTMKSTMNEDNSYSEEFEYDEVLGERGKKKKLDMLNKKKLTDWEMDELFCEFE